MNIADDFNYLGDMNSGALTALESILPELDWSENTARQTLFKAHQNTTTVFITSTAEVVKLWDGIEPLITSILSQHLYDIASPIIEELEQRFNSKVARSMLIILPSGKKISPHPDSGHYLMSVHRCHIPIQTNPEVMFTVGQTTINMQVGQGYEINNSKWHYVSNNGTTDRVHLLIDLLPNNYQYDPTRGIIHSETFKRP